MLYIIFFPSLGKQTKVTLIATKENPIPLHLSERIQSHALQTSSCSHPSLCKSWFFRGDPFFGWWRRLCLQSLAMISWLLSSISHASSSCPYMEDKPTLMLSDEFKQGLFRENPQSRTDNTPAANPSSTEVCFVSSDTWAHTANRGMEQLGVVGIAVHTQGLEQAFHCGFKLGCCSVSQSLSPYTQC